MHHHHDSTECQHQVSAADKERLIRGLGRILPDEALLHQPEDLRPYECDGLSAYRQLPMLVTLPNSVEEIQAIMRLCHDLEVPVVARGTRRPCGVTTRREHERGTNWSHRNPSHPGRDRA